MQKVSPFQFADVKRLNLFDDADLDRWRILFMLKDGRNFYAESVPGERWTIDEIDEVDSEFDSALGIQLDHCRVQWADEFLYTQRYGDIDYLSEREEIWLQGMKHYYFFQAQDDSREHCKVLFRDRQEKWYLKTWDGHGLFSTEPEFVKVTESEAIDLMFENNVPIPDDLMEVVLHKFHFVNHIEIDSKLQAILDDQDLFKPGKIQRSVLQFMANRKSELIAEIYKSCWPGNKEWKPDFLERVKNVNHTINFKLEQHNYGRRLSIQGENKKLLTWVDCRS